LARAVLGAAQAPVRYVAVERSAALRALHAPGVVSAADLPDEPFVGVILANELLDNLPFALLQRTDDAWAEVRVDESLSEVLVVTESPPAIDAPVGARIPVQRWAAAWVADACSRLLAGRAVAVDYCDVTASLARRPWMEWVRTYRAHGRGGHPLADLGVQDVTCEVAVDQLPPPTVNRSQAEFLRAFGLDDLVDEARRAWEERAHVGDLQALAARSRVHEGAALTDPDGLGAFRVLEWVV
jgi:SAM-dependent MidA family methyltransferase